MGELTGRISERFVGSYAEGTASSKARQRRWETFVRNFPELSEMHVLDIGGDGRSWLLAGVRPAHLTLVNITPQPVDEPWMTSLVADACDLPQTLEADLVFSNSVIEHVGGHWRRQRFAEVIRTAASRYWVQTPYRYFPIEPHFLFPYLQHLPKAVQASVIVSWPVGNYGMVRERDVALKRIMDIELLSVVEMKAYFPDARIQRERLSGLTKSLIAVKREEPVQNSRRGQ